MWVGWEILARCRAPRDNSPVDGSTEIRGVAEIREDTKSKEGRRRLLGWLGMWHAHRTGSNVVGVRNLEHMSNTRPSD